MSIYGLSYNTGCMNYCGWDVICGSSGCAGGWCTNLCANTCVTRCTTGGCSGKRNSFIY